MTQPASVPRSTDSAPRWIEIELDELRPGRWERLQVRGLQDLGRGPFAALARGSGPALGLALLARRPDALVVSVGDCVRRGVPTAARATLAARSPLTGLLTEGQVGSELGRRLSALADAFVLRGRVRGGDLLVVRPGGLRLEELDAPVGAGPAAIGAALRRERGDVAWLAVGSAGRAGHPLATLTAGDETPHVVGRGGLGAVLGRTGLRALVVDVPLPTAGEELPDGLVAMLASSPRLRSRAAGGTFELFEARGADRALRARGGARELTADEARRWGRDAESRARERHGCRGCPTPCGWTFEQPAGEARPARFGATQALGPNLGLERIDDAFELLALCDELGLDAKEVGAVLALAARARGDGRLDGAPTWGDRRALAQDVRAIARRAGSGAVLATGLAAAARAFGYEDALVVKGQSVASEPDDLALLALCVSWRGVDPMRTFPFALASLDDERTAELVHPLPYAPASGRLIWWHENLSLALDATGFCSFSAAGLLADAHVDLDRLARWIAPASLRGAATFEDAPGAALLSFGHALALAQRTLGARWSPAGEDPSALDRPAWARARLDRLDGNVGRRGYDEYRRLRGLDERGRVPAGALRHATSPDGFDPRGRGVVAPAPEAVRAGPCSAPGAARPGVVSFRAGGPLGRLADGTELELPLPARVDAVLGRLAAERPELDAWLRQGGRWLPAVFRDGRRLAADAAVESGDRLELVVAIAGGSGA